MMDNIDKFTISTFRFIDSEGMFCAAADLNIGRVLTIKRIPSNQSQPFEFVAW